jgi:hypothetical protein
MKRMTMALIVVATVAAACDYGVTGAKSAGRVESPSPASTPPVASTPSPSPTRREIPARFRGTVSPLPAGLAAKMRGGTWHQGCPVPLSALSLLTLRYWGFDRQVHEGPMVVNTRVARDVVTVFHRLFDARFPIKLLHLATPYRGPQDDNPYDKRDYTVGFNCRPVLTAHGEGNSFSQHASGLAIDISPMENPYVASDGFVKNVYARRYRDRSLRRPGMVHPGDVVVRAFASIGWKWGGYWRSAKDYMHFSLTGG